MLPRSRVGRIHERFVHRELSRGERFAPYIEIVGGMDGIRVDRHDVPAGSCLEIDPDERAPEAIAGAEGDLVAVERADADRAARRRQRDRQQDDLAGLNRARSGLHGDVVRRTRVRSEQQGERPS